MNQPTIKGFAGEYRIVPGFGLRRRRRKRPAKAERNAEIRQLRNRGMPIAMIAEQFGITHQRVSQILRSGSE